MFFLGLFSKKENRKLTTEEFKTVFLNLYPELCYYALQFVNDSDVAKDIVQDVFEHLWSDSDQLRDKSLIKPYLYKAVKNRALNFKKRESRLSRIDELLAMAPAASQWINPEDTFSEVSFRDFQQQVEAAIDELPFQRQVIFRMSRFDNKKHKEIAQELNISPKTVETQIYRSLIFLKKRLQEYVAQK